MVASISKENVSPRDPLAITLKKAFEDQGGMVQQADLEQLIANHGSGLEEGLQPWAEINTDPNGTIDYLRTVYHTALNEVRFMEEIRDTECVMIRRPAPVDVEIIKVPSVVKKEPASTQRGTLPAPLHTRQSFADLPSSIHNPQRGQNQTTRGPS
jgi:hypothetical protein